MRPSPLDQRAHALVFTDVGGEKISSRSPYGVGRCARRYPAVNDVIRFVDAQAYAGSFGFRWKIHQRTHLDDACSNRSEHTFRRRTGFNREALAGKLVLDVGCTMGRFAEVATRWGARVDSIDLTQAAEVAAQNLADCDAAFFQADVFQLPFGPGRFDFSYSIGVPHDTRNCEQAVKVRHKLLKPVGRLPVWLYSSHYPWYRLSEAYRNLSRRMPQKLLYKLCYVVIPPYGMH